MTAIRKNSALMEISEDFMKFVGQKKKSNNYALLKK